MSAPDARLELLGPAERDAPLGARTTYRVGGRAARFVEVDDDAMLERLAAVAGAGVAVLAVGNGSNLLVSDAGFDGVAFTLGSRFAGVAVEAATGGPEGDGAVTVRVGAAALLPRTARQLARQGITGFEWAAGVPGSLGGAVRMNAGGHGSDMAAVLRWADVVDLRRGERRRWHTAELGLGYRRSALAPHQVVVEAGLELRRGDAAGALAAIDEIVGWRRANQPGGSNAGSVFANPPGDSAGRLIEAAGGKGMRVGTAEVSTKHANFIQADEGGRADDVWALMHVVRRAVIDRGGPPLRPETVMVGFPACFGSDEAEAWVRRHQGRAT
ncbi:MAG: UDP-N-acetylmuramate dehydrogenase [Acidimicrobiia bacterium]|nr:UDP-N-acetylmuramate dehydrogenase [Acidimicrobiia bacterium]